MQLPIIVLDDGEAKVHGTIAQVGVTYRFARIIDNNLNICNNDDLQCGTSIEETVCNRIKYGFKIDEDKLLTVDAYIDDRLLDGKDIAIDYFTANLGIALGYHAAKQEDDIENLRML